MRAPKKRGKWADWRQTDLLSISITSEVLVILERLVEFLLNHGVKDAQSNALCVGAKSSHG